jgi:hypothetical protein
VFDFHALRNQFISDLARGGVHPKEMQQLARHSTITLTLDRYTKLGIIGRSTALDCLPAPPNDGPQQHSAVLSATGTDPSPPMHSVDSVTRPLTYQVVPSCPTVGERTDDRDPDPQRPGNRETQKMSGNDAPSRALSRDRERADGESCTRVVQFTKPAPCCSATSAVSRIGRSRTLSGGFGDRLLSQEHDPVARISRGDPGLGLTYPA